jgi:hypothetical protein
MRGRIASELSLFLQRASSGAGRALCIPTGYQPHDRSPATSAFAHFAPLRVTSAPSAGRSASAAAPAPSTCGRRCSGRRSRICG